MFASVGYDQHSLLGVVRESTGGATLTGCSAEGTINGEDADESSFSVVVTVISSEELRWHNGIAKGLVEDDTRPVGKRVAKDLLPHLSNDTIGLFVFPDGRVDFGVSRDSLDNFFAGSGRQSVDSALEAVGGARLAPRHTYLEGLGVPYTIHERAHFHRRGRETMSKAPS